MKSKQLLWVIVSVDIIGWLICLWVFCRHFQQNKILFRNTSISSNSFKISSPLYLSSVFTFHSPHWLSLPLKGNYLFLYTCLQYLCCISQWVLKMWKLSCLSDVGFFSVLLFFLLGNMSNVVSYWSCGRMPVFLRDTKRGILGFGKIKRWKL